MVSRSFRSSMFGIGVASLIAPYAASEVTAQQEWRFHLEEATIADVHRAMLARQLTATQLVTFYLKRIDAYNGRCADGAIDPSTGLQLGEITPRDHAGQLNAIITVNRRGMRSRCGG